MPDSVDSPAPLNTTTPPAATRPANASIVSVTRPCCLADARVGDQWPVAGDRRRPGGFLRDGRPPPC
ncbi:hypothetical protein GCM10023176_17330 [Micromonospora coerulea]|uniref:Uncharacterized protein n=1 Tax=Micromonospora coerulea TaxID=47856 RepID=A0ABP8SEV8_9ACTN